MQTGHVTGLYEFLGGIQMKISKNKMMIVVIIVLINLLLLLILTQEIYRIITIQEGSRDRL